MEANWPAEAEEAEEAEARYDSVAAGGRDTAECPQVTEAENFALCIKHFAPQYAQLAQYQSSLPASPGPNLKM